MATINFYLDKIDKKGLSPIHLRINCNGEQVKLSIGKKVKISDFNKELQIVNDSCNENIELNHYLAYLKDRAYKLLNHSLKKIYTTTEINRLE